MEKSIWFSEGRFSMKTYWIRWLICVGIGFVLGAISAFLGEAGAAIVGLVNLVIGCFMIIQGVERMHNVDKSGWFILSPIYNLILALTRGTVGPNRFGVDSSWLQVNVYVTVYDFSRCYRRLSLICL